MKSLPLTVDAFVSVLKKSKLVDEERLEQLLIEHTAAAGSSTDPLPLVLRLTASNLLTKWQAEKLLQGKYRGFFLGKYKLLSLLGKGGMSSVFLAEHLVMRRRCALKVLPGKFVSDSSYLERFYREARAVASLDHPNIVRAYDVDRQDDGDRQIHFLVMEHVEGRSLVEMVTGKGLDSLLDAAEYARQAADGLQHAHDLGMVHRDIKPGNLLVDPQGVLKILDLGLARFFNVDEGDRALTIQHDEKVLGTADYLAPEQALDSHQVDARADIYSLGCTLYFLLTGQPPFVEGTLAQRLLAHQMKTPPAIESVRAEIPLSLATIVRKMMEKNPAHRYPNAAAAAQALFQWVDQHADSRWRKTHAAIYGARTADSVAIQVARLVARPMAQHGEGEPFGDSGQLPIALPISSKLNLPQMPPFDADHPTETRDTALNLFFLTLAQSGTNRSSGTTDPFSESSSSIIPSGWQQSFDRSETSGPTRPVTASLDRATIAGRAKTSRPTWTARIRSAWQSPQLALARLRWPWIMMVVGIVGILVLRESYSFRSSDDGTLSTANQEVVIPFPADKREVTVGGRGSEYASIREALIAIRERYRPRSVSHTDRFIVHIRPGTYVERIRIDGRNKPWPEGIVLRGEGAVIIQSTGDEPVVRLANVSRFTIENIQIEARNSNVAVKLADDLHETRLRQLVIRGFFDAGIVCKGAQGLSFGRNQLVLEHLSFEPGSTRACGVRFESGTQNDANNVVIRNCRFVKPMAAGIVIQSQAPYGIEVSQSIFNQTTDGLRIEGQPLLKVLQITNNTFRETKTGIRFLNCPHDQSVGIALRRNLFVDTEIAEALIEHDYDEAKFRLMLSTSPPGIESNWSDRPPPEVPAPGEIGLIFEHNGLRGPQDFQFDSYNPQHPRFLWPTKKSPQRDAPGSQPFEPQWVGAIGP